MNKIIISLLFLAISYYTAFFMAKPKWRELSDLKAQAVSYKETLDSMEKMKELRDGLLRQYNSISADEKDKLSKMFASSLNEGELMVMFDDITKASSLTLTDISFQPISEDTNSALYNAYNINMNITGTYNGFKNFLKNIEKSLLITDINSITLNTDSSESSFKSKGSSGGIYNFKIAGSVYLKN